jgi:hypothetical protein
MLASLAANGVLAFRCTRLRPAITAVVVVDSQLLKYFHIDMAPTAESWWRGLCASQFRFCEFRE